VNASITLTAPGGESWFGQDWHKTIIEELFRATDELGRLEQYNVSARTPVDTGALLADVQYTAYSSGTTLVDVFADDEEQLAEYNRVYALYQEGGALGLSTYTNAPREMFAKVLTDDIPQSKSGAMTRFRRGLTASGAEVEYGTNVL
jgi:hypothetical protein